jgi:hypothetical protein
METKRLLNFVNNKEGVLGSTNDVQFNSHYLVDSPMSQFEIKPFLGEFLGLNYTPLGFFTNILVYIGLVVLYILSFFIYGGFKDNIQING